MLCNRRPVLWCAAPAADNHIGALVRGTYDVLSPCEAAHSGPSHLAPAGPIPLELPILHLSATRSAGFPRKGSQESTLRYAGVQGKLAESLNTASLTWAAVIMAGTKDALSFFTLSLCTSAAICWNLFVSPAQ